MPSHWVVSSTLALWVYDKLIPSASPTIDKHKLLLHHSWWSTQITENLAGDINPLFSFLVASYIGFNDQSLIITVHWWGITPMTHNSWSLYGALLTLEIAIVDCLQKSMTRLFISWPSVHQQSIDSWSIQYTARTEGDSSINTSQDTHLHTSPQLKEI